MNPLELHVRLQDALDFSIAWSQARPASRLQSSNAARSGFFCAAVGKVLKSLTPFDSRLRQIGFCESRHKFESGEWMLDGAVVELDEHQFVRRIHVAMECESSTSKIEFATDFGKLLNVKAKTKVFLHGLDQITGKASDDLVSARCGLASQLVRECDPYSDWFLGFWPSPKKVPGLPSLWDDFYGARDYAHLAQIRLYRFDGQGFSRVLPIPLAA